jgi:hypothetical protein
MELSRSRAETSRNRLRFCFVLALPRPSSHAFQHKTKMSRLWRDTNCALVVTPRGFEPPTNRTGICHSIQLNYGARKAANIPKRGGFGITRGGHGRGIIAIVKSEGPGDRHR